MKLVYIIFSTCLFLILMSCDPVRVYENNIDMPGNDWYVDSVASFPFEISSINQKYNLYINVRNAVSYPFANLYVHYYLYNPQGKVIEDKLLRLPLFDKKTGKPYGNGLGDIFDHRFSIMKNYTFSSKGKYKMDIKQYMRQDPLPFVMAIGFRVEQASR